MEKQTIVAIVDLCEYRLSHRFRPHDTNARSLDIVREGVTRSIMEDYAGLPIVAITLAINEVNRVLCEKNGSFCDAVEAAALVMRPYISGCFLWELRLLKCARFRVVEQTLRYYVEEGSITFEELEEAIRKAHTLIDGGGCITPTLYQVLGEKFDGTVVS